jgi:maltokinase
MMPLAEPALRQFLEESRSTQWFTGKDRAIANVRVAAEAALADAGAVRWTLLDVVYDDGGRETYQAPLVVDGARVHDALDDPRCARALVDGMRDGRSLPTAAGALVLAMDPAFAATFAGVGGAAVVRIGGPQSNASVRVGDALLLKVYRKPEPGVCIEREIAAHLTAQGYANAPRLYGTATLATAGRETTMALLFEYVAGPGDLWTRALRALQGSAGASLVEDAARLGGCVGELHHALGAATDDPAFRPADVTPADHAAWAAAIAREVDLTIDAAARAGHDLAPALAAAGGALRARALALADAAPGGKKTRIHGDLHLGQVLVRNGDFVIFDFEGEPARSREERRDKYSPLRDVAGVLRSFAYAEAVARREGAAVAPGFGARAAAAFVDAYRGALAGASLVPEPDGVFTTLLAALELQKALYEVRYELQSRPDWVAIPASRLLEMAAAHT